MARSSRRLQLRAPENNAGRSGRDASEMAVVQSKNPAEAPAARSGDRLTGTGDKTYRLKNGAEIECGLGVAAFDVLTALLERHPRLFQSLLTIVRGRPGDVSAGDRARLRKYLLLRTKEGEVCPHIPDVLLSAYRETPDGPVLVNPFHFESADQPAELERRERASLDWLVREVFRDDVPDDLPPRR